MKLEFQDRRGVLSTNMFSSGMTSFNKSSSNTWAHTAHTPSKLLRIHCSLPLTNNFRFVVERSCWQIFRGFINVSLPFIYFLPLHTSPLPLFIPDLHHFTQRVSRVIRRWYKRANITRSIQCTKPVQSLSTVRNTYMSAYSVFAF